MEFKVLSFSSAKSRHLKELGLRSNVRDESYFCELLRSAVWLLTLGNMPVHTIKILNTATKISVSDLEPDSLRQSLANCLEELRSFGEIISFPRGYWLPAPLNAAKLPSGEQVVLVGGPPSKAFPPKIRSKLTNSGPVRRAPLAVAKDLGITNAISLKEWAQVPDVPLLEWANLIKGVEIVDVQGSDSGDFLFYLPHLNRAEKFQSKRWKENAKDSAGRFLAKRSRIFGGAEFHIVEMRSGQMSGYSAALPYRFGRRLMYAEDLRADRPTEADLTRLNGAVRLSLSSQIPYEERKICRAIGELTSPENEYPIEWSFPIEQEAVVVSALRNLGIKIRT